MHYQSLRGDGNWLEPLLMFSLDGFLSGQFRDTASPIQRLDPRVKLAWAVGMMLVVAFTLDPLTYATLTVYLITIIFLCRIPFSRVIPQLRGLALLFAITLVLHLLFTEPEGSVYLRVGAVVISEKGLTNGLLYSYRVFLFLLTALALNISTSPVELSDGLVRLLGPLRSLRVPIDDLGMMLFLALRFVPVMAEEAAAIRDAQMSRGARRAKGFVGRIKALIPLVLPLLVSSVRKAHYLALAIQSRGYRPGCRRTSLRVYKLGTGDAVFMTSSIVFLLASVMIRRMLIQ
jgi:energy-coupling factor transport system permease protein